MSKVVNLYEAKTQLSGLVDMAAHGEEIVIAKNGRPMARLVSAVGQQSGQRQFGQWARLIPPAEIANLGSPEWWRAWKEADAEIEREFASAGQAGGKKEIWPVTSSTRTRSSGSRPNPTKSRTKRSRR